MKSIFKIKSQTVLEKHTLQIKNMKTQNKTHALLAVIALLKSHCGYRP